MKRQALYVLLTLFAALVTAGCEKELLSEDAAEGNSDTNVVLHLSVYEEIPFDTRTVKDISQLSSHVNVAFFQNGTKVKTVAQKAGDSSFGTVSTSLTEGTYQIVVIAHNSTGSATITSTEKVTVPNNLVSDSFYYYGTLTVGTTQTSYNLELTRIVAMFRLELSSALPSNVAKIRFYYTGGSSTFSPQAGYGCVNSRQTVMMTVEPGQKVYEVYTFPHEEKDELKIIVTVYDENDNVLKEHTFENVPVTRNKITRYTGDFFNGGGTVSGNGIRLTANDEWDGAENYSF